MPDTSDLHRTPACVLGFDFGFRRIGVAIGQTLTHTASALETVPNRSTPDWDAISRLVGEWQPDAFIIGLPLGAEGEETSMSEAARGFGRALQKRFDRPCEFIDERLTSHDASERFVAMRSSGAAKRKHSSKLDAVAAQIIIENWLQSLPGNGPGQA